VLGCFFFQHFVSADEKSNIQPFQLFILASRYLVGIFTNKGNLKNNTNNTNTNNNNNRQDDIYSAISNGMMPHARVHFLDRAYLQQLSAGEYPLEKPATDI